MQIIGIAYGTPEELYKDREELRLFMKNYCHGGAVKKYEFWDITFKKEYQQAIIDRLARPHPTISGVIKKIYTAPVIGNMIKNFFKEKSQTDGFEMVVDERPDTHHKSPDFTILMLRNDFIRKDGSENL